MAAKSSKLAVDLRRDWRGWSAAERFTAKLVGAALLYLGVVLALPHGF